MLPRTKVRVQRLNRIITKGVQSDIKSPISSLRPYIIQGDVLETATGSLSKSCTVDLSTQINVDIVAVPKGDSTEFVNCTCLGSYRRPVYSLTSFDKF